MPFSGPLRLKANFSIGTSAASAINASSQITGITISASRGVLTVPPTGTTGESVAAGAVQWSAKIDWLANDVDVDEDLTRIFFTALNDDEGVLYMGGTMREGGVSAANPKWAGSILVGGLGMGGAQETLALDSQTFRMLGAPSITTS